MNNDTLHFEVPSCPRCGSLNVEVKGYKHGMTERKCNKCRYRFREGKSWKESMAEDLERIKKLHDLSKSESHERQLGDWNVIRLDDKIRFTDSITQISHIGLVHDYGTEGYLVKYLSGGVTAWTILNPWKVAATKIGSIDERPVIFKNWRGKVLCEQCFENRKAGTLKQLLGLFLTLFLARFHIYKSYGHGNPIFLADGTEPIPCYRCKKLIQPRRLDADDRLLLGR